MTDQWKYHEKYQKPSFSTHRFTLALILRLCKTHIILSGILEICRVFFILLGPQVLRQLLTILEDDHESQWHGFEYCILLVAVGFFGALCETHTYYQLNNAGIKMKTALISAIYRKSLKMIQPHGKTKMLQGDQKQNLLIQLRPPKPTFKALPTWGQKCIFLWVRPFQSSNF